MSGAAAGCVHSPLAAPSLAQLFGPGVAAAELPGGVGEWPLHDDERTALDRSNPRRQQEFSAGRACARAALAQLGRPDCAVPMNTDRSPRWPAGMVGSITHCRGYAAAVAAHAARIRAIGLDAERCVPFGDALIKTICTPVECAWIETLDDRARMLAATALFCTKEAFYKCQYPLLGLWLEFDQVSLRIGGGEVQVLQAPDPLRRLPWRGRFKVQGDIVLAGFWLPASP